MPVLTANDLKTKGVSDIDFLLQDAQEVVISVRGKPRFLVMDIAHYDFLRECEIAAAWAQTRSDLAAGHYRACLLGRSGPTLDSGRPTGGTPGSDPSARRVATAAVTGNILFRGHTGNPNTCWPGDHSALGSR